MIFLIHYNRSLRELIRLSEFTEWVEASKEKLAVEIGLLGSSNGHEVVLLEAEDEKSLKETHSRYFSSLEDIRSQGAFDTRKAE